MTPFEIIYVDDDLEDLDLFAEAVNTLTEKKLANIRLTVHASARPVLNCLDNMKNKKTILFLDINMPGKNGLEVLEDIRNESDYKDIPVLMYSTSTDQKSIDMSYNLGANAYLVKPTSFQELQSLIQKVLQVDWQNNVPDRTSFLLNPQGKRV